MILFEQRSLFLALNQLTIGIYNSLALRKYILYWGFYETCDREAATTRGHLEYTDTLIQECLLKTVPTIVIAHNYALHISSYSGFLSVMLTKYNYVIHRPVGPYWEKLCPRSRVGRTRDRGHSFFPIRTDQGRSITFLFISKFYFFLEKSCFYNKMNWSIHCFFMRKLNNNTCKKTIKTN